MSWYVMLARAFVEMQFTYIWIFDQAWPADIIWYLVNFQFIAVQYCILTVYFELMQKCVDFNN